MGGGGGSPQQETQQAKAFSITIMHTFIIHYTPPESVKFTLTVFIKVCGFFVRKWFKPYLLWIRVGWLFLRPPHHLQIQPRLRSIQTVVPEFHNGLIDWILFYAVSAIFQPYKGKYILIHILNCLTSKEKLCNPIVHLNGTTHYHTTI